MHRSSSAEGRHTDLTVAGWTLVADLLERDVKQGVPPRYKRRPMVNACCCVVRTGTPWRLALESYAPWTAAYMCINRHAARVLVGRTNPRLA